MLNSFLLEILRTFSKDDLKSFEDFILSPYHNKKTPAIKLYNHIKKYSPDFSNNNLHREEAWKKLFPSKEYNYGVMKNLIYDNTRLLEEFISISDYKEDELGKKLSMIRYLYKTNKINLAEKYIEKADIKISNPENADSEYYLNIFNIEKVRTAILFSKISDKHKAMPGRVFEQSSRYLLESFLISILENYVMINGLNKIHKSGIRMPMLEEVLKFVKSNESFLENIYIKVYYFILLLDREQDERYYFILKKILSDSQSSLPLNFKYTLWENISNYIIFRIHAGELEFTKEQFELNKLSLSKNIFFGDEKNFFLLNFLNFFNIATRINELDWAESFINEYISKLDTDVREDIKNYCFAEISIKRKNFQSANEYLSKVKKLHEPHMKAGLKLNVLIVYYELRWYESSLSIIDSFKHLLDNEKNIQEVIKNKYRKFIRAYSILIEIVHKKDEKAKQKLYKYLKETEAIGSVNWLKRKAAEAGVLIK